MIGIYMITNICNNKKYIGQSVDVEDRIAHHKSSLKHGRHENSYLQRQWDKYGEENFVFSIIQECTEDQLDDLERMYIKQYGTMDHEKGYNFESGGSLHKHMQEEQKEKMRQAKLGKYDGENNPMYGVHLKLSEERKQKLSERFSGKGNPMYGRKVIQTKERKQAASKRMKGDKNPFYGKTHTEETRDKMRHSKKNKPVLCVETNQQYIQMQDAARQTGIETGSISRSCRTGTKAGNYHWKYVV